LRRDRLGAAGLRDARVRPGGRGRVRSDDDVGVEQAEERLEVAGLGRGDEGVHELPLTRERDVRGRRAGTANPLPGAAGELPRGGRRPFHDRGDVPEREPERIVEDECEALQRRQPVEDDEQRQSDRIGEERLSLG
jgi:hypothetical protein